MKGFKGMAIGDKVRSALNLLGKSHINHKKHLKRLRKMNYLKTDRVVLNGTHHLRWEFVGKPTTK